MAKDAGSSVDEQSSIAGKAALNASIAAGLEYKDLVCRPVGGEGELVIGRFLILLQLNVTSCSSSVDNNTICEFPTSRGPNLDAK